MSDLLTTIVSFLLTVLFLGLGGLLLLAGRQYMWVLLGAGGFLITATVAAEIQGYSNSWALIENDLWWSLLIAALVGIVGAFIGLRFGRFSVDMIGFAVGVYVATWFDEVLLALNGQDVSGFTWWIALIFVAVGVLGIWITRRDPDQAQILISVIIGSMTIANGLNLDKTRSITAVITLGLALTGVVVQYASYLREQPRFGSQLPPVPHPTNDELPYS